VSVVRCSSSQVYQVSPSNQQNVETTSYQGILANQVVCHKYCRFFFGQIQFFLGEIIIMMTLMLVKPTSYLIGSMIGWMIAGITWLGGALTSF
jgi:hypothetical protein